MKTPTTLRNDSRSGPITAASIARGLATAAILALPALIAQAGVVLTTLHSFQVYPNGSGANGLVQGSDGNFYGTTGGGGTNGGAGTVFKISTNGTLTTLFTFTVGGGVANPQAALVQGSDGSFYGTTGSPWLAENGAVFKIDTNGALTTLYSFGGGNDGAYPSGLVLGNDGNFYGTTTGGGANGFGTAFEISASGTFTLLCAFGYDSNARIGGGIPNGLVQGSDGNFYGTSGGGEYYRGTVFKIYKNGLLTTLYSFTDGADGGEPKAGLVLGNDGNFYGTTTEAGANDWGTVFKIGPNGGLTTLYSFPGGSNAAASEAALAQGSDGYLYGAVGDTLFKISTNGALTTLYSGSGSTAALAQGSDGYFYGTTGGALFKITTNGVFTPLYTFSGGGDGANPSAPLAQGGDGSLYGTTVNTIFKITTNGALTTLHAFTNGTDGSNPSGLTPAVDGNFYGTTPSSGPNGGTVFQITTNGALTTFYTFPSGGSDSGPNGLVQGSDGNFYGMTQLGGTNCSCDIGIATPIGPIGPGQNTNPPPPPPATCNGAGAVFQITTNGALTPLYALCGNIGQYYLPPVAGLARGSDGNLYGTTYGGGSNIAGTVFQITTTGLLTTLYSFTGGPDGGNPAATLVQGSDGNFYGTTSAGGISLPGAGTVFKISASGAFTHLYSFTGSRDGAIPSALAHGADGYFYGATQFGGDGNFSYVSRSGGHGTLFQISADGGLITLYSFTRGQGGANPQAGLVQAGDGNFYGTTPAGGLGGAGTVFRLALGPRFQAVSISNSVLTLNWSTTAGAMYQLQYNTDLSSTNWIKLGSPIPATGATLSFTNPITTDLQQFYRVLLLP